MGGRVGQREEQNGRKASRFYMTARWGSAVIQKLWVDPELVILARGS